MIHFDAADAARLLDLCSAGVVVIGVVMAASRSIGRTIWLVALQATLLAIAAAAVGVAIGSAHLLAGAAITFLARGLLVPMILAAVLRRSPIRVERNPYLGPRLSLVAAVAIVFAAAMAVDSGIAASLHPACAQASCPLQPAPGVVAPDALPASIAEILTGLLIAMTRRKSLSIVVGLLVFENGLALTAFSLTYGLPIVVELGAAFDLLLAAVAVGVYARGMLTVMGTLSTDELRSLRG